MNAPANFKIDRHPRDGLRARTVIVLGFDRRELHIETSKASRGVSCRASVYQKTEDGQGLVHAFAFGGQGDDFRRDLSRDPAARATEKTLTTMHAAALAGLPALLASVHAHYGKPAPGAALTVAQCADVDDTAGLLRA